MQVNEKAVGTKGNKLQFLLCFQYVYNKVFFCSMPANGYKGLSYYEKAGLLLVKLVVKITSIDTLQAVTFT